MSTRLDRIFIRVKTADGKWDSLSLTEVNDEQFDRWLGSYIKNRLCDNDRNSAVQYLDFLRIPPVEIKEEAYDDKS